MLDTAVCSGLSSPLNGLWRFAIQPFTRVSAVASLSALNAESQRALCARLEALDGVERVLVDAEREGLWLVLGAETERSGIPAQARAALLEADVDPQSVALEVTARLLAVILAVVSGS